MPKTLIYITALLLLIGAAPMPYGYYTLLRLVACGVFGYAAFTAFNNKLQTLPWIYMLLALAFNPIIKIHLSKVNWTIIDIGAAILLLATYSFIKQEK